MKNLSDTLNERIKPKIKELKRTMGEDAFNDFDELITASLHAELSPCCGASVNDLGRCSECDEAVRPQDAA